VKNMGYLLPWSFAKRAVGMILPLVVLQLSSNPNPT